MQKRRKKIGEFPIRILSCLHENATIIGKNGKVGMSKSIKNGFFLIKREKGKKEEFEEAQRKRIFWKNNGIKAIIAMWTYPGLFVVHARSAYTVFILSLIILVPIWYSQLAVFDVKQFFSTLFFIVGQVFLIAYFFLFFSSILFSFFLRLRFCIPLSQAADAFFFYGIHEQKNWLFWTKKRFVDWFSEVKYLHPSDMWKK